MKKLFSILALFGAITLLSETKGLAEMKSDPAEPTVNGHYQIAGNWSELKRGWNVLSLKVTDMDQRSVSGATVVVAYDMVGMPMNPPDKPVVEKGDGLYEKRVFLGMNGTWKFDITVNANSVEDTLTRTQEVTK